MCCCPGRQYWGEGWLLTLSILVTSSWFILLFFRVLAPENSDYFHRQKSLQRSFIVLASFSNDFVIWKISFYFSQKDDIYILIILTSPQVNLDCSRERKALKKYKVSLIFTKIVIRNQNFQMKNNSKSLCLTPFLGFQPFLSDWSFLTVDPKVLGQEFGNDYHEEQWVSPHQCSTWTYILN